MLFSNPKLASELNQRFECVWEELRPAPRARIDFGNGAVLEQTLNGNVASLFLTPQGNLYDVIPGILDAGTYGRLAGDAARLLRAFPADGGQVGAIAEYLARRVAGGQVVGSNLAGADSVAAAKRVVEFPLKGALGLAEGDAVVEQPTHAGAQVQGNPGRHSSVALSKRALEGPMRMALGDGLAPEDRLSLQRDTHMVLQRLMPQALGLLAKHPGIKMEAYTQMLFREVLHVDLSDPFLGLAPDRLGGGIGRHYGSDG